MKKNRTKQKIFSFALFFVAVFSMVLFFSFTNVSYGGNGEEKVTQYQLLEPLPGGFGEITNTVVKGGLGEYLKTIFTAGIAIAGILAVLMLVIAGIEYMAPSSQSKSDAKDRITSAISGLLLALTSFLILNLINPDLIKFKGLDTKLTIEGSSQGVINKLNEAIKKQREQRLKNFEKILQQGKDINAAIGVYKEEKEQTANDILAVGGTIEALRGEKRKLLGSYDTGNREDNIKTQEDIKNLDYNIKVLEAEKKELIEYKDTVHRIENNLLEYKQKLQEDRIRIIEGERKVYTEEECKTNANEQFTLFGVNWAEKETILGIPNKSIPASRDAAIGYCLDIIGESS